MALKRLKSPSLDPQLCHAMRGLPGSNTDYYRNTISICYLCLGMKVTDTRPPCFSQESLILEAEGKPATVLQWMLANVPAGGSREKPWSQRRCRWDVCFPRAIVSEVTNCRNSQLNGPRPLNTLHFHQNHSLLEELCPTAKTATVQFAVMSCLD